MNISEICYMCCCLKRLLHAVDGMLCDTYDDRLMTGCEVLVTMVTEAINPAVVQYWLTFSVYCVHLNIYPSNSYASV